MSLIGWILVGLIAGGLARWIVKAFNYLTYSKLGWLTSFYRTIKHCSVY